MGAPKGRIPWNRESFEEIKEKFEKKNCNLLTIKESYIPGMKLDYICPNNHHHSITLNHFNNNIDCPYCKKTKVYIPNLINELEEINFKFIDYKINKLSFICNRGHEATVAYSNWKYHNTRCPYCSGRLTYYKDVEKSFEEQGYKLTNLDKNINSKTTLTYICPNNHKGTTTFNSWKRGKGRCKVCIENDRLLKIKKMLLNEGYELVSIDDDKFSFICDNGHENNMFFSNWYNGQRCGSCINSKSEREVKDFISELGVSFIENSRSIIKPKELDIYIPDKKIAIEYNGIWYHSELKGIDKKYHLEKTKECEKQGIQLIQIFESEWKLKNEIVKNRLKHILGISNERIYARKCVVKIVPSKECKNFLNENHIQGFVGSSIKLGLYHNDELVSVMTFAKQNISKGSSHEEGTWELNRFCIGKKSVVGAAGKLLKYFELNYEWKKIVSFADRRWSNGNLYFKLGFNLIKETPPNYWYFKNNDVKLHHRFNFRRSLLKGNGTEWEIMQKNGWNRIWDCGSLKFEKLNES